MAIELKLPRLAQEMESGTIVMWRVAEGARVNPGDPIYEVDTDKVTHEVESEFGGTLLKITVPAGEVQVGQTVAYLGDEGEELPVERADEAPALIAAQSAEIQPPSEGLPNLPPAPARPSWRGEQPPASPRARRIAREARIDLTKLAGTGPGGRIVARDVHEALEATPGAATADVHERNDTIFETQPLTAVRRTIARRLTAAWQIPVFQLGRSVDVERARALLAAQRELNPTLNVTLTDVILRITAAALARHPEARVQYTPDELLFFTHADVGLAVATERGVVVPVIRHADEKQLDEIAAMRDALVSKARAATLTSSDLQGGIITVSNLGMFGVHQFTAVLNPPQALILAVGSIQDRVVAMGGAVMVRPTLDVVLTADHRAIDGAEAALFLQTFALLIEEPALAL